MAYIVPDSVPSNVSQGEKTLFGILRDRLPDDFMVWHEPSISNRRPDFVILAPTFGLLIIEVKGWSIDRIEKANHDQLHVRYSTDGVSNIIAEKSPLKQAHDYFCVISDQFKKYSVLCNLDGVHQGKLAFPIGQGAVMSRITEAEAETIGLQNVFEKPQVAYRDELLAWQSMSDRDLIARLKSMFSVDFPFYALTDDQISTIKGIMHPETQIRTEPATRKSLPAEVATKSTEPLPDSSKVIVSLDPEQETLARKLGDGHRIFAGVAGSGKTLILMARAKLLANEFEHYKILVLCYHKSLAAYLRSLIYSDDTPQYEQRIEVLHFNGWAKHILGTLPSSKEYPDQQERHQAIANELLKAIEAQPTKRWDAILIDEGHTFAPDWFKCCVAALKENSSGKLFIACDGNQKIYKRKNFTWSSVGVKARGRTKHLKVNYRNTREIVEAAWAVIDAVPNINSQIHDPTFPLIAPKTTQNKGPKPVLNRVNSLAESVNIAYERIEDFRREGYEDHDIAVIFHSRAKENKDWLPALKKKVENAGLSVYWMSNDYQKRHFSVQTPGIRFVSTESALGLEFKAALIMEVERFVDRHEDETIRYRQLYVAMTRAQERLHLVSAASHPFTQELEATGKFKVSG